MKNHSNKNLLFSIVFGATLLSGYFSYAQYPTVSLLLSNTIEYSSINSTDDFVRIEERINSLASILREAHEKYPNFKYSPAYNNGEIVAFIISGAPESGVADSLSLCLMQLEVLGSAVRSMDVAYLPTISGNKIAHVSKKEASR